MVNRCCVPTKAGSGLKAFAGFVFLDGGKLEDGALLSFETGNEGELALGLNELVFKGLEVETLGRLELNGADELAVHNDDGVELEGPTVGFVAYGSVICERTEDREAFGFESEGVTVKRNRRKDSQQDGTDNHSRSKHGRAPVALKGKDCTAL
jgi:hypothetical protein